MTDVEISKMQAEYIKSANKRWNVKMGATQSGKTYIDTRYVIPNRILERVGEIGINVIVGVSKETIERNVLTKMRDIWGKQYVSEINSRNVATLFGEKVYCLGAKDKGQVSIFRGATIKYLYVDEFPDISQDVFNIFASRLSTHCSLADLTGNPQSPSHWSELWLEKMRLTDNFYFQQYTLFDNPFLHTHTRDSIIKDYEGTVYYSRYVLGLPKRAEGLIYSRFADNAKDYIIDKMPTDISIITVGLDYGASKAKSTFKAVGLSRNCENVYILAERDIKETIEPTNIYNQFHEFYTYVKSTFGKVNYAFADWGGLGKLITNGLINYCARNKLPIQIQDCKKGKIIDRIALTTSLFAQKRLFIMADCKNMIEAFSDAVWDTKNEDTRLDDGTTDIDSLDAFEYAIYPFYERLITSRKGIVN